MAKSSNNVLTKGCPEQSGDLLTFRQRFGKTVVGKLVKPSTAPATEKATTVRVRFKLCTIYAIAAAKDPEKGPLYKALAKDGITAYNLALKDAIHAPKVNGMDTSAYQGAMGDINTVQAKDDFKVVSVWITIHDETGTLIEQGHALLSENE